MKDAYFLRFHGHGISVRQCPTPPIYKESTFQVSPAFSPAPHTPVRDIREARHRTESCQGELQHQKGGRDSCEKCQVPQG